MLSGCDFQQMVGIPKVPYCARILADLFLYLYEADFRQGFLKKNENNKLARSFNFTLRYINDVLSLICFSKFHDYVDLIHPFELEMKDATDTTKCTAKSTSYIDLNT